MRVCNVAWRKTLSLSPAASPLWSQAKSLCGEGPGAAGLPGLGREMGIRTSPASPDAKPPYHLSRETRARELTLLRADRTANHLSRKQSHVSPCPDAFSLARGAGGSRAPGGAAAPAAQRAAGGGDLALPGLVRRRSRCPCREESACRGPWLSPGDEEWSCLRASAAAPYQPAARGGSLGLKSDKKPWH